MRMCHIKNCDISVSVCIKGHWYCMKHGLDLMDNFFEERERNKTIDMQEKK